MSFATPIQPLSAAPDERADQRLVMLNVPWTAYEAQLALRGDAPVPRVAYLDGVMELMSPSREHERIKSYIGRLVETYALERDVDLSPYGAWTLRRAPRSSGLEPDECYIVGADQRAERPDLAIEVVWTSGGLDKLEIYRRLEVPEVWVWRDGALTVHLLRGDAYEAVEHSEQLPGIDLALLVSFLDRPTAMQAVRAYRDALRGQGAGFSSR
jgi:Uma2 family endonuclease